MAYNGFPATYQPVMYQPQMQQIQQMQPQMQMQQAQQPQAQITQNNPMIWVQGETGAKSYLLAPNTTLPLWDSESQTIYLKSTDASGMPSMKIIDYTIRNTSTPQVPVQNQPHEIDYVTRDELEEFKKEIIREVKANEQSNADHADANRAKKQSHGDSK